jgi:hypothetical protein
MTNTAIEFLKKIIFRFTNLANPKYDYNIEPAQLLELLTSIDNFASKTQKSCIVEIGVARGMTTRFLSEHISLKNYDVEYYCIDTFSSFTDKDLNFEVKKRGKNTKELLGFSYNDYKKWKINFKKFSFIKPIKHDCSTFDFSTIAPINLCFLDVDLYLPTKNTLNNIWDHMAINSTIIVDDVMDNNQWDGAYQAFMEFVNEKKLNYYLVGNKCGVIKKVK